MTSPLSVGVFPSSLARETRARSSSANSGLSGFPQSASGRSRRDRSSSALSIMRWKRRDLALSLRADILMWCSPGCSWYLRGTDATESSAETGFGCRQHANRYSHETGRIRFTKNEAHIFFQLFFLPCLSIPRINRISASRENFLVSLGLLAFLGLLAVLDSERCSCSGRVPGVRPMSMPFRMSLDQRAASEARVSTEYCPPPEPVSGRSTGGCIRGVGATPPPGAVPPVQRASPEACATGRDADARAAGVGVTSMPLRTALVQRVLSENTMMRRRGNDQARCSPSGSVTSGLS